MNNIVAFEDDPGAINNPSARSDEGFAAATNPFSGGLDLSTSREEPPVLLRRITVFRVTPLAETVPILIFVVQPSGFEQFGIVIQGPPDVELWSTATGALSTDPIKTEYPES